MAEFDYISTAQITGYFALLFGVVALIQTKDIYLKLFLIAHSILYAVHFFLLGELGAVIGSIIAIVRISLSIFTRSWLAVALLIFVNLLFLPLLANDYWHSLLPILTSCILTVGLFRLSGIPMRVTILIGSGLWLIHNIIAVSVGGIVLEIVMLVSTVVSIVRVNKASH